MSCLLVLVFLLAGLSTSYTLEAEQVSHLLPYQCPYYCHCNSQNFSCENGYSFDVNWLRALPQSLEHLSIKNHLLRHLPSELFSSLDRLQTLEIVDCGLESLHHLSFTNLGSLRKLNLGDNHIHELPDSIFNGLTLLEEINLGGNYLEELRLTAFAGLSKSIKVLKLNKNLLRLLPPQLFDSVTHLEYLDLSNNRLSYILPRAFSSLSYVKFIDLSENLLVTINEDLFHLPQLTALTEISVSRNPFVCNCGLVWLKEALSSHFTSTQIINASDVVCFSPHVNHGKRLVDLSLRELNCSQPEVSVTLSEDPLYYGNQISLECHIQGNPHPSVVWKTPMGDVLTDPLQGEWLDNSVSIVQAQVMYKIYSTGETIEYQVRSYDDFSRLSVSNAHLRSAGGYTCFAMNPGGISNATTHVLMSSAIEDQYLLSLAYGGCAVAIAVCFGIIGCSSTACVEYCSSCESPVWKYYDGDIVSALRNKRDQDSIRTADNDGSSVTSTENQEGEFCLGSLISIHTQSSDAEHPQEVMDEVDEYTALTADDWDYLKEISDDVAEVSIDDSPGTSVVQKSNGKTLEALDAVRMRLKLRLERIEIMKGRLRNQVGKHSTQVKGNMARQKKRMNKKMQTIKESTSNSIQSIKETGRNYSHKLHMGMRSAMENVGAHVQSLKEFCGTGDLGQTMSIATITTDIDTSQATELRHSVTLV